MVDKTQSFMFHALYNYYFSPTLLSTNCVSLSNKLGTEGRVKLLPLSVDKIEPANKSGSSLDTSTDTAWVDSSVGSSPTRVWDKIVLPTSSSEFRISLTLALDYKYDEVDLIFTTLTCSTSQIWRSVCWFISIHLDYLILGPLCKPLLVIWPPNKRLLFF